MILSQIGSFVLSYMEYLLHFLKLKSVRGISIPPNYITLQISTRMGLFPGLKRPENVQYTKILPTVSRTIGRHYYLYKVSDYRLLVNPASKHLTLDHLPVSVEQQPECFRIFLDHLVHLLGADMEVCTCRFHRQQIYLIERDFQILLSLQLYSSWKKKWFSS